MKLHIRPVAFMMFFSPVVLGQNADTLLYERFETGGTSFTLNTTDMNSVDIATGYNEWMVGNEYTGGTGSVICLGIPNSFIIPDTPGQPASQTGGSNTGYMHMVSDAAVSSGISNCNYLAASGICGAAENYFARMAQDVSTSGYDSVTVSFLWLCVGANNNYGELYYSTDSGTSWILITVPQPFNNQPNWTTCSVSLPAFAGQANIRFGFRFVNQVTFNASDPGFGVDEFLVTAKVSAGPPIAQFSVSDSSICEGACVDFSDLSVGSAPTSWLWIFQGAATSFSTSQFPTGICYPAAGTYTTTLIVTNSIGTDTLTAPAVTVFPVPPVPTLTVSGDTLFAPPGFATYTWYLDGVVLPVSNSDTLVVLAGGNYSVMVTGTGGCTAESLPVLMTTGIQDLSALSGKVFPNPTSGNLSLPEGMRGDWVEITDLSGRIIRNPGIDGSIIRTEFLPAGSYVLSLYDFSGNLHRYRFQKSE